MGENGQAGEEKQTCIVEKLVFSLGLASLCLPFRTLVAVENEGKSLSFPFEVFSNF